jgi:hypothetical protein
MEQKQLTETQHQLLKELETTILDIMGFDYDDRADFSSETPIPVWDEFPTLWNGYGPDQDGCFRAPGVFENEEDVNRGIHNKFYCIFSFVRNKLAEEFPSDNGYPNIYIDADYEGPTYAMVLYHPTRKVLIFHECKAWNFYWDTPVALAESIENWIKEGGKFMETKALKCPDCDETIREVTIERFLTKTFTVDYEHKQLVELDDLPWDKNDYAVHCGECDSLNIDEKLGDWPLVSAEPNFIAFVNEKTGEREYGEYVLVKAANINDARQKIKDWIMESIGGDDTARWENETYYYSGDMYAESIDWIQEIKGGAREAIYKKMTIL